MNTREERTAAQSFSRRLGYRLLPGEGYSYILHLRPREWPIVAAHALFGYLIAIPAAPLAPRSGSELALGLLLFVVFLNGGTLAINSAYDRDEGDIGYLDRPPPVPRHLLAFGLALMAAGQLLALLALPSAYVLLYAACFLMSILYSTPPFRWKAVAGLDLGINALGFGVLTAGIGWSLSGAPLPGWALLVLLAFGPLFAALYPLTQLYQFEEDRRRGDRTLALVLGMRNSLLFALAMVILAFGLLLVGLHGAAIGSFWLLPIIPAGSWIALLLRWLHRHASMSPAAHKAGMYRALQIWALTNVCIVAAVLLPHLG